MRLKSRLTEKLAVEHPILLAPMNVIAGGKLAAAVSNAGGLGLIGGGYGDPDWLELQYAAAGKARVGCGFITFLGRRAGVDDDRRRLLNNDMASKQTDERNGQGGR
jgi:NAD(P)H-dependent flavin oxidoreductase YrpB (nitropropane dioxygenase family)